MSFGVEGMEPIEGTEAELCAVLDGYPELMVVDLYLGEKAAGSDLHPVLLRYVAKRFVDGFEEGRLPMDV